MILKWMTRLRKPSIRRRSTRSQAEAGVALLISLFALMLICIVGVALIMASGTDTALTGNYRSATSVYYAALAGLEEGRGRLLTKAPNSSNIAAVLGLPPGSLPSVAPGAAQVWYIINPLPSEIDNTTNTHTSYPDAEYAQEFPTIPAPDISWTNSTSAQAGLPGPIFKWVRINAITATSAQTTGIPANPGGPQDTPLLYANNHLYNDPVLAGPSAQQAIEITALAVLQMPNGSLTQQMLQYVVAPAGFNLNFPAALTLDGNGVAFSGPAPNPGPLVVNGIDSQSVGACRFGGQVLPGIGYTNGPPGAMSNATGSTLPSTDVTQLLPPALQQVSSLDTLAQSVQQNADSALAGNQNGGNLPPAMNAANPMTVAVDGDLDLSTWSGTGYGVLLVQGTLKLGPNANWNGEVLVIGLGTVDATLGSGQINGAVVVAQTRNIVDGPLLANVGASSWTQQVNGPGIFYSTCWINAVQSVFSYKVLSFREIPLS